MPPHNVIPLHPRRALANVLLDLREARRDWEDALNESDAANGNRRLEDECGDRMSEADQRIEALRDEFAEQFRAATGLTWKQIEEAISEAVL